MNPCARCGKTVYPTEELKCLDKVWHKACFKCDECGMALSMKNYKGFNKTPYCSVHCPQVKATTVTETPESRRLAENTRLQSQVKYHEDFEKSKGKFTTVADDPETMRVMSTHKVISNVSYHGDIARKQEMEQRRVYLPSEVEQQRREVQSQHQQPVPIQKQNGSHHEQPQRHQVYVQPQHHPQQQQMVYNMHHHQGPVMQQQHQQGNRVHQQQHPQQHPQANIKILSQGNKPVEVKQQSNNRPQHTNGSNPGMKQPPQQQYHPQQQPANSKAISAARPVQQQPVQYQPSQHHPSSSDPYNQNHHQSPVRSSGHPNQQSRVVPQQQQQHVPPPAPSGGSYSVLYDGSGQRVMENGNHKVGSILDFDPMTYQMHPSSSISGKSYVSSGPPTHAVPASSYQYPPQKGPQQQPLPSYGAAVHHQQMMAQQQQHQQYLLHQQQSYSNNNSHHVQQQQHGSPLRTSSSGVMPASAAAAAPHSSSSGFSVRAIYDYSANDDDEVSFLDGDLIVDCVPIDEGWITGTVHRTRQRGMLPGNYVEPCQ